MSSSAKGNRLFVAKADAAATRTERDALQLVLIHGAMDRHNSFRRVNRRLNGPATLYDRRGYGRSVDVTPPAKDLERHVADLLDIIDGRPSVVVGHSIGGLIALTAAAHFPEHIVSVAAFEPPTAWKPWWPDDLRVLSGDSPADTVERFFRKMVGDHSWEHLRERIRNELLLEGPALQVDLEAGRHAAPFHFSDIDVPTLLGYGSLSSEHHIRATEELFDEIPTSTLSIVEGAPHGAHRSHPGAFAAFVESALSLA